jgi:hypothetical protein
MLKAKSHKLLDEAFIEGIVLGVNRAFKHREDRPTDEAIEAIQTEVVIAIWGAIDDRFHIEDEYKENNDE